MSQTQAHPEHSHHHHHHHHHHHKDNPKDNHQQDENTGYDVKKVMSSFRNCVRADGVTIDMAKFILAYKELVKFFDMLGKIFSFVAVDLIDKFHNIEKCMTNNSKVYATIQSAVKYEKENNIHMVNSNATLSVLRLIRGLDFIRQLLDSIFQNKDNQKKPPELAWVVYDKTLAHRHKWTIRQLVKAGFYLLPRKSDLLKYMYHGVDPNNTDEQNNRLFLEFIEQLNHVYSIIHKVYDDYDFLELVLA